MKHRLIMPLFSRHLPTEVSLRCGMTWSLTFAGGAAIL